MPDLRLPLSGDVNQTINPWTWYFPFTGNQFGLVNITLGNAGNPEAEKKILDEVGSYGKQLGRIGDALRILVHHVDQEKLSGDELKTINKLLTQLDCIDQIKDSNR
jgi:hypothetical protein